METRKQTPKSTFSEPLDYYSCIHKCVLNPYKKFFDGGHEKKEVGKDKRGRNLQNFNFWRFLREIFQIFCELNFSKFLVSLYKSQMHVQYKFQLSKMNFICVLHPKMPKYEVSLKNLFVFGHLIAFFFKFLKLWMSDGTK